MSETTEKTPLEEVTELAESYAASRDRLAGHVSDLEAKIEALKREHLPRIRAAVRLASVGRDALKGAIEDHPELWTKRRTLVIAGVRVGITKGKGKLVIPDAEQTIRLIRRHFPDQAEAMIRVKEEPIAKTIGELNVAELKKIGAHVTDADDQVVIKSTDGDVDKLVAKLLEESERLAEEEG